MTAIDIGTRAQIIALKAYGVSNTQIEKLLKYSSATIQRIWNRALQRGFNPHSERPHVLRAHVEDAARTGRPAKTEEYMERLMKEIEKNPGRKHTYKALASATGIKADTVSKILRQAAKTRRQKAVNAVMERKEDGKDGGEMDVDTTEVTRNVDGNAQVMATPADGRGGGGVVGDSVFQGLAQAAAQDGEGLVKEMEEGTVTSDPRQEGEEGEHEVAEVAEEAVGDGELRVAGGPVEVVAGPSHGGMTKKPKYSPNISHLHLHQQNTHA